MTLKMGALFRVPLELYTNWHKFGPLPGYPGIFGSKWWLGKARSPNDNLSKRTFGHFMLRYQMQKLARMVIGIEAGICQKGFYQKKVNSTAAPGTTSSRLTK